MGYNSKQVNRERCEHTAVRLFISVSLVRDVFDRLTKLHPSEHDHQTQATRWG